MSLSFVALAPCFVSLSCWKTRPQPIISVLVEEISFNEYGSVHWPLNVVKSKTSPKHVSISMLDCGNSVLWVILAFFSSSKHNRLNWCQTAQLWFRLTAALSPKPPLSHLDVHWQTEGGPVHEPSWAGGPYKLSLSIGRLTDLAGNQVIFPPLYEIPWASALWLRKQLSQVFSAFSLISKLT